MIHLSISELRRRSKKQRNSNTAVKNKNKNSSCRVRFSENINFIENNIQENISDDVRWYSIDDINQTQSQICDFILLLRKIKIDNIESLELLLNTEQHRFLRCIPIQANKGVNNENTIRGIEYLIDANKAKIKKKRIFEGVKAVLDEQKEQKQQQQQQQRKRKGRFHNIIRIYKKDHFDLKYNFDFDAISECYIENGCTIQCQKEAYERGDIHFQDTDLVEKSLRKETNCS